MARILAVAKAVAWKKRQIDRAKKDIKEELDGISEDQDKRARLRHAMAKISELDGSDSPPQLLRRFIYIISALAQHQRAGGLTEQHVNKLSLMATVILQTEGVKPITSKLSFLYGELHLVLSQIHRKTGRLWIAAWEQQMARQMSGRSPVGGEAFMALAEAIRLLRLGHGLLAIREFLRAEASDLAPRSWMQARLGRIKALRLSGQSEAAIALTAATEKNDDLARAETLELSWERMWIDAVARNDLRDLVNAVRPRGSHHSHVYLLETFLASCMVANQEWLERLPSVQTMARNKQLKPQRLGFFYKAALQVERCYDYDVPFATRLRIGTRTERHALFGLGHKELLVWGAGREMAGSESFVRLGGIGFE